MARRRNKGRDLKLERKEGNIAKELKSTVYSLLQLKATGK